MSRTSQNRSLWKTAVAVSLLFAAIAVLQTRIDAHERSAQTEDLVLRSGRLLKELSLGYDALLGDIYWTRAVQYYGERVGTPNATFELLGPLLDITTTLDPRLLVAYRFGAIFLSEPVPVGAGRTDLAVDLVKRGIAANPDQWPLYYDLGFLYYWRLKDYPDAAQTYLAGGNIPGAPLLMKLMAARIAQKGGSIDTSIMIFSELYQSTKDPNVRKEALAVLRSLKSEKDCMQLDELIDQYTKRFGRTPASMKELSGAGLVHGIPVDPLGFPYVIGPDGKSRLNSASPIQPPKP